MFLSILIPPRNNYKRIETERSAKICGKSLFGECVYKAKVEWSEGGFTTSDYIAHSPV